MMKCSQQKPSWLLSDSFRDSGADHKSWFFWARVCFRVVGEGGLLCWEHLQEEK